jgi:cytochrome c oxidase subunit 3
MRANVLTEAAVLNGVGGRGGSGTPFGNGGERGESSRPAGVPQRTYITGVTIALAAILMFFAALVSSYVVRKGLSPADWRPLALPRILWLNTFILLGSSFTLMRSRRFLVARDEGGFRHWWGVTTILGIMFLAGQVIAWGQLAGAGVYLATNPAGSFFYVFTVAHGVHLFGGIAALLAVNFRTPRRPTRETAVEVASIYWHFMDGLWLFLFAFLLIGSRP